MSPAPFQKHLIYWFLPAVIIVLSSVVYFLDVFGLAQVIAPDFNREFGLLENGQLFLLLIIFYLCFKKFKSSKANPERSIFLLLAFLTIFIFLEEMDYGLHYLDYINGKTTEAVKHEMYVEKKVRNIHNTGKLNRKFKSASYVFVALFFVVLPLLPASLKQRFAIIRFLSPGKWIITTAVSLLITNNIVYYVYKNHNYFRRSMDGNVNEFEETMIYYIVLLYIWELVNKPEGILSGNKIATHYTEVEGKEVRSQQ